MEDNYNLTPREITFCEEYLRTGKREESAIAAGYSAKGAAVQANKMLKKDNLLAYIRDVRAQARKELGIDDNWAVLRAIEIYNRCMQATPVMAWSYENHCMEPTGDWTFDSKGALKALEFIKSLLGLGEKDTDKLLSAVTFIDDLGGTVNE